MSNEERYKEALERIASATTTRFCFSELVVMATEALNPPPQYTEEEVVRFAIMRGKEFLCSVVEDYSHEAVENNWPGAEAIKFTIPVRIPVKPKVKRRREIEVDGEGVFIISPAHGHKYFDEWQE